MTTKHLIITERAGTHLEFISANGRPGIIATDGAGRSALVYFDPEDTSAIMLAVAKSAGVKQIDHRGITYGKQDQLEKIAFDLGRHLNYQKKHAAEEAELEREALALCLAVADLPADNGWPPVAPRAHWIKIARAARGLAEERAK